jgi:hypothetical protein
MILRKYKIWYRRTFAYREDYLLNKKYTQIYSQRCLKLIFKRPAPKLF